MTEAEYDLPDDLKSDIKEHGLCKEVLDKLKDEMEAWKKEKLNIAVVGQSRQGKSSFVNVMMGLKWNSQEGAKVSAKGVTTYELKSYTHPRNSNVILWDCPGIDGTDFKRDEYFEKIRAEEINYDFYLIVTKDIFSDNALYLAESIHDKLGKVFYLVRTYVDSTVKEMIETECPEREEDDCAQDVKDEIGQKMKQSGFCSDKFKIYMVSNKEPHKYEYDDLQHDICEESPSQLFREAYLFTISAKGRKINQLKHQMLQKRCLKIAMLSTVNPRNRVRGINCDLDFSTYVNAAMTFIIAFGLDKQEIAVREKTMSLVSGKIETKLDNFIWNKNAILHLVRNQTEISYDQLFDRKVSSVTIAKFLKANERKVEEAITLKTSHFPNFSRSFLFQFFETKTDSYIISMYLLKELLDVAKEAADYLCEMKFEQMQ